MKPDVDHKKIYGAGYHAGLKAAGGVRGNDRGYMDATEAMLCWTPDSGAVRLVRWPDLSGKSNKYEMTGLACYSHVREMSFEQRKALVFVEAMHLIVRDGCYPKAVHDALLGLREYRDGCACDMPGL